MTQRLRSLAISLPAAVFIGVFLIWPVLRTVQGGLIIDGRLSLSCVSAVLRHPVYLEGLRNAALIAICVVVITGIAATGLSLLAQKYDFPLKGILTSLLLVPMILPPFVGAIGLRQMIGEYGALNALLIRLNILPPDGWVDWLGQYRMFGIIALESLYLYPIMYLNAAAALANIDPAMEEAAENLGSRGWHKFFRITLPLMMPGLFAGGTIVFIWSFTELGTPLMLDFTRITSVQIFDGIKDIGGDNPFPYALTIVLLVTSLTAYGISKVLWGRHAHAAFAKATVGRSARRLRGARAWLVTLPFTAVIALAVVPHVGVLLTCVSRDWYQSILPSGVTLDHFRTALGHSMALPSMTNSLQYAGWAMLIDVGLGLAIAWVVVRSNAPWRGALDALSMLPLAVPGMVVAFGYLSLTQIGGPLAFLVGDPRSPDPYFILIFAYAVRRLPYMVRSIVAGLQQTSVTLEEAAANLGCPPVKSVLRITLPLISANLLAGALLTFSFAMLEVSDSLMLAQTPEDYPITKAIFHLNQLLGEGRYVASALGAWAMLFLTMTILCVSALLGKRMGALFRT